MARTENVDAATTEATTPENGPEVASLDSSWVFIDRPATVDEVKALLASVTVPYSGGRVSSPDGLSYTEAPPTTMEEFLPFILPMSNRQKVKTPDPSDPRRDIETQVRQTSLYTQVAGRLAMLNAVAAQRRWTVDIYPEKDVSTGMPGYLRADDRLLFRVYVEISQNGESLGRKFGTASGMAESKGFNAEASNPYETVETSALGRALAQWGFGILPGSGIASVEEMRLARQNLGQPRPAAGRRDEPQEKEARGDLIASTIDYLEKRRKMTGADQTTVDAGLATWVHTKYGMEGFVSDGGGYEWQMLTDNQIALLRNATRDAVVAAVAAGEGT